MLYTHIFLGIGAFKISCTQNYLQYYTCNIESIVRLYANRTFSNIVSNDVYVLYFSLPLQPIIYRSILCLNGVMT